ncbi:hypothetical protein EDD15DRAFT_2171448, partial [Pisolithus albus]
DSLIVQATRRLSVWRSNFGSTALAIMAHFLASATDNTQPSGVRETCNELLDGLAFLYQDLDPSKPENAYRSQFVLQLLAHTQLRPCIGCPDVPKLNTSALKEHGVQGALSLSCAAVSNTFDLVERRINSQYSLNLSARGKATARTPLKFNKTSGKESSTALSFSEQNWGSCTRQYFMSINKRSSTALKEIVVSANALVPSMDGPVAEDSSLPDDALTDDLLVSANQRMSICRHCFITSQDILTSSIGYQ